MPLKKEKFTIVTVGRLIPDKRQDRLLSAAKKLKENGSDFIWYFVGDGPEKTKLEKMIAEYGLSNNIVITGMQKNPYPYMAACDIYVQPSYEEALGLTILETHRLNKPVISTATVGGKKLVESGKNGIVCEISSDALAESITDLTANKELYNNIISNLETTDYSHEFEKYKSQWQALLD